MSTVEQSAAIFSIEQIINAALNRTPAEREAVAANLAARSAARRDERVSQIRRFGDSVFYAFIDGRYVEGSAADVVAALREYDRRAEPVVVRMNRTIDDDYAIRGVFEYVTVGREVTVTHRTAMDMLRDARKRVEECDSRSTRAAFRAFVRHLEDVTK